MADTILCVPATIAWPVSLSEVEVVIENVVPRQPPVSGLHVENPRPGFLVVAVVVSGAA